MRFSRQVMLTMAVRVMGVVIAFAGSVLVARYLGPSGRGVLSYLYAISATVVQFGNLGLHSANTYYGAKEPSERARLVGNSLWLGVGGGTVLAVTTWFVLLAAHQTQTGWLLIWLILGGVPLHLTAMLLSNTLVGFGRIRAYNVLEAVRVVETFGRILVVFWILHRGLVIFLGSELVILTGVVLVYVWVVRAGVGRLPHWPVLALMKKTIAYGLKAYVVALFGFLVIRADVFLVQAMLNFTAVGYYTISTGIANYLLVVPATLGLLVFPTISAGRAGSGAARTAEIFRIFWPVYAVLCLATALLAGPVVRYLYGPVFMPAVPALLWLLPGVFALGLEILLSNDLAGRGFPPSLVASWAVALTVNLLANLWAIPHWGISGASIASSVAYIFVFFAVAHYFLRRGKIHWKDLSFPQRADFRTVARGIRLRAPMEKLS